MVAPDKYSRHSTWWRVACAVFPNVRRDQLEDVVARAWAAWMMLSDEQREAQRKCIGIAARRRVLDAARSEWGRDEFPVLRDAAMTCELPQDCATHDDPHEDTEEVVVGLARRGASARLRAVALGLIRGLTQREIAERIGFSEATVSADVQRLRDMIEPETESHDQEWLSESGPDPWDVFDGV